MMDIGSRNAGFRTSRARRLSTVAIAFLMLGVSACGGGSEAADSSSAPAPVGELVAVGDCQLDRSIVDAARAEGAVSHQGNNLPRDVATKSAEVLKRDYGIELTVANSRGGETIEKVRSERRTGNQTIDTVSLGSYTGEVVKQLGFTEPFLPEEIKKNLVDDVEYDPEGNWYPFIVNFWGVGVNKSVLDPGSISGWDTLATGSVPATLLIDDPTLGGGGFTWAVSALNDKDLGEEYLKAIGRADNVQFSAVRADSLARLARGDVGAFWPFYSVDFNELGQAKDSIELVFPGGKPYPAAGNLAVIKGAAHPNAAKVWACYLLGEPGQRTIAESNGTPVRAGVAAVEPKYDYTSYTQFMGSFDKEVAEYSRDTNAFVTARFGR